ATPSLEKIEKILANLTKITTSWADDQGTLNCMINQLKDIVTKINEGKGSLGQLVNDPGLYKDLRQAVSGTRN
ncbi:MAG: hypothetical protein BZ151_10565, partial [Desulfobacca sp. 4484_104]